MFARKLKAFFLAQVLVLSIGPVSFARVQLVTGSDSISVGVSGSGSIEAGQFVKFWYMDRIWQHQWIQNSHLSLSIDGKFRDRIAVVAGMGVDQWYDDYPRFAGSQSWDRHLSYVSVYISQAEGSFAFGNKDKPPVTASFGIFPYKYNSEVRNLGEYLFRTNVYPACILNEFDAPYGRLTGLKVSGNFLDRLHLDLLLTMETTVNPYHDFSPAALADFDLGPVELGGGIQLSHLLSVSEQFTTPKNARNMYLTNQRVLTNSLGADSIVGDTNYYSFRGAKLMGRITIDPKKIFRSSIFGKEYLKLYSEVVILGLKGYPRNDTTLLTLGNPYGYDSLTNRIPFVIGINVPTFRLLDVLSFEWEWFGSLYPNNISNALGLNMEPGMPIPGKPGSARTDYHADDIKWSLYARKTIDDHLSLTAQVANDHTRIKSNFEQTNDREEVMGGRDNWWWVVKLTATL